MEKGQPLLSEFASGVVCAHYTELEKRVRALEAACLGLKDRVAGVEDEISFLKRGRPGAEPQRETAWSVVADFDGVRCFFCRGGFIHRPVQALWLRDEMTAEGLAEALGLEDCRPALLYKDTLEEVIHA